jgi:hypothetical protein
MYNWNLWAIVETMKPRHHYHEGANHKNLTQCAENNIEYFQKSTLLTSQKARCVEIHSLYDFILKHWEGNMIPMGTLSWSLGYEIYFQYLTACLLDTITAICIAESNGDHPADIKAAKDMDLVATIILPTLFNNSVLSESWWRSIDSSSNLLEDLYSYRTQQYWDNPIHSDPKTSHFRPWISAMTILQSSDWPPIECGIEMFIDRCELSHPISACHHMRYWHNVPLLPLSCPCLRHAIDFASYLPESSVLEYIRILGIVNCLTKIVTYLHYKKGKDSAELA